MGPPAWRRPSGTRCCEAVRKPEEASGAFTDPQPGDAIVASYPTSPARDVDPKRCDFGGDGLEQGDELRHVSNGDLAEE
jgi:hypothetical protein